MNPRLKSSKKWTQLPKEYSEQIQAVFKENFAQYVEDAELIVEGRIYPEEIMLRIGFHQNGRLAQANFEVSMNYSYENEEAISSIHTCVDAAASMMIEYFEQEGDVDFPYTWKEYPFQGKTIHLKFSSENTALEAEANRLLGIDNESLVNEDTESEDALAHAENSEELSPPREEDEDEDAYVDVDSDSELENEEISGPKMFGGKPKKQIH